MVAALQALGCALVLAGPAQAQAPAAGPAPALTLEDAWKQADAYNKTVLGQRKQLEVSQELIKNARSERLPRVPLRGEYAYLGGLYAFEPRAGLRHPDELGPEHILRRVSNTQVSSFAALYRFVPPGALLDGKLPEHAVFRDYWEESRSDTFAAPQRLLDLRRSKAT